MPAVPNSPAQDSSAESFSDRDRFMIAKTEEAIRDGLQLERWWREREPRPARPGSRERAGVSGPTDRGGQDLALFPLDLKKSYRLPNKAEGFFSSLAINGSSRTVMGCRQTVEFTQIRGANPAERLREFVLGEFLKRAHWNYEDGAPGGFTFEKSLFRTVAGNYGQFPAEHRADPIDWRDLGRRYAWVLHTVHIHDFVATLGPFKKRIREAAYVAPHPDFVHVVENPSRDCVLEVSIGYPFVDVPPFPNIFGFGPGKFGVAVKLFSFLLTPKNEIRVRMVFAAAPRAQKVLDFGKHLPDPVYGGAEVLRYLTLGLVKPEAIHDRMDTQMLTLHCQVHQTLMDGLEKVWNTWAGAHP